MSARFLDLHGALLGSGGFAKARTTDEVGLAPGAHDVLREGLERSLAHDAP